MTDAEDVYDDEIAPLLLRVGELCEKHGFSFVGMCEWTPGETGITVTRRENASVEFRLAEMAAFARGNVDALMMAAARYGREHGHGSIVLAMMEGTGAL